MSLFTSQYYDKPDGEDYVGKMFASNRLAVSAAIGVGENLSSVFPLNFNELSTTIKFQLQWTL